MHFKCSNLAQTIAAMAVILFFNSLTIKSQNLTPTNSPEELRKLIHTGGCEQFYAGAGLVKNGWNLNAGYVKYFSKNLFLITDFTYETVNLSLTTVNGYYLSASPAYTLLKISGKLFMDVKAGLLAGEETAHNQVLNNQNLNNFVFGEKAGLQIEYFISECISVNAGIDQRFINNSRIGTLSRSAELSLSYNF